jgi:aminopeptidase N
MRFVPFLLLFFHSFYSLGQGVETTEFISQKEKEAHTTLFSTQSPNSGQNFDVKHYRCEWEIDPNVRYIKGKVRITFKLTADTARLLKLDFYSGLGVDSVIFRGQKQSFGFQGQDIFWIKTNSTVIQNQIDSVSIHYKGIPNNSGFGAFNKQFHAGQPIIWTMSCPYAARDWWPCKQSLDDKADSIDLIISTPSQYRAAGNGLLVSELQVGNKKIYHWKHKYPIATYLVATAITNYTAFTQKVHLPSQAPGDSLPVVNFVYPETLGSALTDTKKVLPILQFYDSLVAPYPFRKEKYGHAQFGWGGGMEHQTMSFMTDFSFSLQAHELAHQWFGDFITCRSWRDIWLNEGWATYMAALSEKRFATSNFTTWLNSSQNTVKGQAGGSVWVNDTTDINRVFDYRLTYLKGALVLHMLRWEIGDVPFWQGVRNYQSDVSLGFGFASTQNFIQHLETASGKNLSGFLADWFIGQGYPSYTIQLLRSGQSMKLTLNQTSSHPSVSFFEQKVPIRFRATGFDTTIVFQNESNGQVFNFTLPFFPTSSTFDPEKWLIAKGTIQLITSTESLSNLQNQVSVFPNPFTKTLHVSNESEKNINIQLFNNQGQLLRFEKINPLMQQKIELNDLAPGIYFIRNEQNGSVFTRKLVKE